MHHTHAATDHEQSVATRGRVIHWAGRYDLVVRLLSLGRAASLRKRLVKAGRVHPGSNVLDVGCGTGDVSLEAWKACQPAGAVIGIDPSAEMVLAAREKAAKAGARPAFRTAAIEALPFPAASFDTVFSSLMMHHLPADVRTLGLSEVLRVLRPGGTLAIMDFRPPTGRRERLATHLRLHGHGITHDLLAELSAAGFSGTRAYDARAMGLAFYRAIKPAD